MANKLAKRYVSETTGCEYLVLKEGAGQISADGEILVEKTKDITAKYDKALYPEEISTLLGRKYVCEKCGTLVICSHPSKDILVCCGEKMTKVEPKAIKAAF